MESSEVVSLLEQLDDEIDDLEDSLAPMFKTALSTTSSKLPLIDKAKLYVLVTYAIESMLFSYLRLNGVKAREHPVFKELIRVKQYFDKIKAAETSSNERPVVNLDKRAAARFIKAGLTGNDEYDSRRAERQDTETIRSHTKFKHLSEPEISTGLSVITDISDRSDLDLDNAGTGPSRVLNISKKRKADAVDDTMTTLSLSRAGSDSELPSGKLRKSKEERRRRKKNKKNGKDEKRSI